MGRVYKRKTTMAIDKECLSKPAEQVKYGKMSVRGAATNFGLSRTTLQRYISMTPEERLASGYEQYKFSSQDLYNIDKTGFTTVQVPSTVVSQVGKKQVGAVTSGERGQLVTVLWAINASGSDVPPFYVFPQVKVNLAFLIGALPGTETAATKSGWMKSEIFSDQYLPFFIRQTRCSKHRQVLLNMDNHSPMCR
ncbi:unnamed protein product [Lepeophtheirus salmonis]|uniref:(salmon louse) hypothetical protein n=1 Tax=Lepeophtheirus salmonis TaxID=72036 RepID=A0A7R8CQS6_LEPSM|nr:unnamed protein product [Lepeophtheirus salmonis]CAF2861420.1 unnamed protein product [Lepeophtheirus salmonis]